MQTLGPPLVRAPYLASIGLKPWFRAWAVVVALASSACGHGATPGPAPAETTTTFDTREVAFDTNGQPDIPGGTEAGTEADGGQDAVTLACPLTAVDLVGSDPYPPPIMQMTCGTGYCWAAARKLPPSDSDQDLLEYFNYNPFLVIYHWQMGDAQVSTRIVEPVVAPATAFNPGAGEIDGSHLIVSGWDKAGETLPTTEVGHFDCPVALAGEITCQASMNPLNPSTFLHTASGQLLAVNSRTTAKPAGLVPVVLVATAAVKGAQLHLDPPVEIPWNVPDIVDSAVTVGEDVVVAGLSHGWCGRLTLAGQVKWSYFDPADGGTPTNNTSLHHVVAGDSSRVVLWRSRWLGSKRWDDLVALSFETGKVLWQRELGDAVAVRWRFARAVGSHWYVRWLPVGAANAPSGMTLEWTDLESGRVVGLGAAGPLPNGVAIVSIAQGPTAELAAYMAVKKPSNANAIKTAEGVNIAGLADSWGNMTCETSGPCWKKTYADCSDGNPCTSDLCDAAHNGCYHVALPDGFTCSDAGGKCVSGVCK